MLIGHRRIWDFLTGSAKQDRLAHAYFFVGPAQTGKLTAALEFSKWLFCPSTKLRTSPTEPCGKCKSCLSVERGQNPDLLVLRAKQTDKDDILKNKEIGIVEIRALRHKLSLSAYGASYKIAIIEEVAALSGEAMNSLLKTLEEPSPRSLIILISSSWQAALPTIVSRCQLIKFLPVPEIEMSAKLGGLSKKEADFKRAIKLSAGRPGLAMQLLQEPERLAEQERSIEIFEKILKAPLVWRLEQAAKLSQNTVEARETLDQWVLCLRDRILEISGCADLAVSGRTNGTSAGGYRAGDLLSMCREIQKTRSILHNSSFNARLALEVLMTKI